VEKGGTVQIQIYTVSSWSIKTENIHRANNQQPNGTIVHELKDNKRHSLSGAEKKKRKVKNKSTESCTGRANFDN